MIPIQRINKAVENIKRSEVIADRKNRLLTLVNTYGLEQTAAAANLNPSSINQYLKSSFSTIGLEPLTQAETILLQLSE